MPESRRLPRSRQTTRTDRKVVPRAEAYPNAIIRKLHRGASGVTMVTPALPDHRSDMSTDLSRCGRLNLRVSLVVSPAMESARRTGNLVLSSILTRCRRAHV